MKLIETKQAAEKQNLKELKRMHSNSNDDKKPKEAEEGDEEYDEEGEEEYDEEGEEEEEEEAEEEEEEGDDAVPSKQIGQQPTRPGQPGQPAPRR